MVKDDVALLNRHLAELRQEVTELRQNVEEVALMAREATLKETFEKLQPVFEVAAELSTDHGATAAAPLVAELHQAWVALGLQPLWKPGDQLELWPDEAQEEFVLDRSPSPEAPLVRVEVVTSGWQRGSQVICRPRGRVLEEPHDGH
jgi:hypothetical protein